MRVNCSAPYHTRCLFLKSVSTQGGLGVGWERADMTGGGGLRLGKEPVGAGLQSHRPFTSWTGRPGNNAALGPRTKSSKAEPMAPRKVDTNAKPMKAKAFSVDTWCPTMACPKHARTAHVGTSARQPTAVAAAEGKAISHPKYQKNPAELTMHSQ